MKFNYTFVQFILFYIAFVFVGVISFIAVILDDIYSLLLKIVYYY